MPKVVAVVVSLVLEPVPELSLTGAVKSNPLLIDACVTEGGVGGGRDAVVRSGVREVERGREKERERERERESERERDRDREGGRKGEKERESEGE